MKNKHFILLLLIFFLLFPLPYAFAEEDKKQSESKKSAHNEDEAPTAIFQTTVSDKDVDLYLQGSWDISATGSLGYDLSAGKFIETPFQQMAPGFVFSQIPDLTISLWFMKRYFFEATIKEDSGQNTFLIGYQGKDDEFVQKILIGNTKIDIEDYAFLSIPSIPKNSLGASAAFKTRVSYHELLLRYDPAEGLSKEFIGNNEVKRQIFMPTDYYRGRLFILPDTDFDNIEVYIEDDKGSFTGTDRRRYKRADNTDFTFSISDGTITLRKQPESRILVYYTKGGREIGHPTLGIGALVDVDSDGTPLPNSATTHSFNWGITYSGQNMEDDRQVIIEGTDKKALLIFNRGEYSPFESLSYYQSSFPLPDDISKVRFGVSAKSNNPEVLDERLKFRIDKENNLLYVYDNSNGVRNMRNRYPLSDKFSTPDGNKVPVYGPSKNITPGAYRSELRLEVLLQVGAFMLDPDIVPGSVTVKRNGNIETMYDIDYASGIITFRTYIHPNDRIKITYKTSYADTDGGDLLFATGNRFFTGDYLVTELAFGIKWNILKNQYSRFAGQYKGSMLFTGGAKYTRENYKIEVDTGLSLTSQDTTGILRLFDMQQSGITMRLGNGYIYPASIPENKTWDYMEFGFPPSTLPSRGNRGQLIYKDYYSYTLTNATLNNYNWNVPDNQIYSYTTGNPPGPYPANASNDGIMGEILVMDMDKIPISRWAGAQVPVRKFAAKQDLTDAESISFLIRCENVTGTGSKFYIQIGTISEDLDGDGILDQEDSIYSDGFAFNDPANGTIMRVGGVGGSTGRGNGMLDSEDNDLNGVLDLEDPRNVVTIDLSSSFVNICNEGVWKRVNHNFSSTEKKLLAQSSAVRFIYVNETASESSGRIFIGELFIETSPFSATVTSGGTDYAYAKEVQGRNAEPPPPAKTLMEAYPEIRDIFFKNADISSTQKVLETGWKGKGYTLTGYSTPVPYDMYRKLVGYIRISELDPTPAEITISYTDTTGRGIEATFKTEDVLIDCWKKFEIDLEKKKIYLAGIDMGGTVRTSSTNLGLSMLKITCDAEEGRMFLDEIHLTDPKLSTAGAVAVTYEHNFPGTILSVGETDIISNLYVKEYVMYAAEDFSVDLNENSDSNNARTKTTLKTDIFKSNIETNIDLTWVGGENYSTIDHTYRSPLFTDFLTLTDSYSESRDLYYLSFAKYDELKIKIGDRGGTASASAESMLIYNDLSQRWDFRYKSDTRKKIRGGTNLSFIKVSTGYIPEDLSYIENWFNSFSLIIPEDSDPWPDRTIISENNFSVYRESFGVDVTINAGTLSSGEEFDRRQKSSGKLEMQFPFFNTAFGGWKFTPGYSRTFEYINKNEIGKSFPDDTQLWFEDFSRQSYFYTGIPFAEFFLDSSEKKFRDESAYLSNSRYTPEVFAKFFKSRNPSITDFIAPSELNIRYLKEFAKEDDTYTHTYKIAGEYVTRAINMFGDSGLMPIFSFYKTDEFITRFSVITSSVDTPIPQDREFILRNSLYFAGHKETELIIDNKFGYVHRYSDEKTYFYDTASASYMWITRPSKRIEIKYFSDKNDPDPYFAHTESLAFITEPESTVSDYNYWSILITHESSLIFPEKGNLKVLLSIGVEKHRLYESFNSENTYLLGLQAGIFGRLMF